MAELKLKKPWQVDSDETTTNNQLSTPKPPLLEPHYADVYNAWKANKTPATSGALLRAVEPVLNEATRSYAGGESDSVNAMTTAKRLALEAFERYDPHQAKLKTHLLSHLRGIRRVVQRANQAVYIPEQHRLDSQKLSTALPLLIDELGRHPSDAELADHLGLSLSRLKKARNVPGVVGSGQIGDSIGVEKEDKDAWDKWIQAIYLDSHPTDQIILQHSLGLHGNPILPANEIAKRVGLSSGAISQRKVELQKQLDMYDQFLGKRTPQ